VVVQEVDAGGFYVDLNKTGPVFVSPDRVPDRVPDAS
jgi:hypothetical protein